MNTTTLSTTTTKTITTTSATSSSCLSSEEQSILKTALAFVILRNNCKRFNNNRRKCQKTLSSEASTAPSHLPPFCQNLLQIPSLPFQTDTSSHNEQHVNHMLQIALSSAPLSSVNVMNVNKVYDDNSRFTAVAAHLANHLLHSELEWLIDWIFKSTLKYEAKDICSLWHCMAQTESDLASRLITAVGQLLDNIYHDRVIVDKVPTRTPTPTPTSTGKHVNHNGSADTLVVNLLLLIEVLFSIRHCAGISLKQLLKELLDSTNHKLTLFIPVREIPLFLQSNTASQNLSASSKVMVHLALYDLTVKLTL